MLSYVLTEAECAQMDAALAEMERARAAGAQALAGLPLVVAGGYLVVEGRPLTSAEMDAVWEACRAAALRPTERGAFKVRQALIERLPRVPSIGYDFEPTVLDAYEVSPARPHALDWGQSVAWCPHCRFWHRHGLPIEGRRGPHCYVRPHAYPVEYTLRDCGKASPEIMRDVRRRRQMT